MNVVMGLQGVQLSLAELVRNWSQASQRWQRSRAPPLVPFFRASREMREHGTFAFAEVAVGLSGSQRHVYGVMRATK